MEEKRLKEIIYEVVREATQGREVSISKFFAEFEKKLNNMVERLNKHDTRLVSLEQINTDKEKHGNRGFVILGWVVGVVTAIGSTFIGSLILADKEQKTDIHKNEVAMGKAETDILTIKSDLVEIKGDIKAILKIVK